MSNEGLKSPGRVSTTGGAAGKLPIREVHSALVGPSLADEFNVIELDFAPEACVRFDDVRFEFDSSFIGPESKTELKLLGQLHNEDATRPASIFGHADPSGNDDYNKQLSGRRAQAMYGLLTRKTELWEDLFKHPQGGDDWGTKSIQTMLKELGHYSGPINGVLDGPTKEAVKKFQSSPQGAGLVPDGDPGQNTRPKLYLAYMNTICIDEKDQPFTIHPVDGFLAHGADAGGKGDFQGCSEFNPDMVFSKPEDQKFKQAANKAERDRENNINRRVVVYLFRSGSEIKPASWPCPKAKEGVAQCRTRFHADGDFRRTPRGDQRRTFDVDGDTFACNFYDRISLLSPCEQPPPPPPPVTAILEFVFDTNNDLIADATDAVTTFARMGLWDHAFDAAGAVLNNEAEANNFVGADTRRFYLRVKDPSANGSVQVNWRTLDAAGNNLDAPADQRVTLLETGPGTGVFTSKSLMLVTDNDDQNQPTHSGLPAGNPDAGVRNRGQSNHRIRRAVISGSVEAEFTQIGGATVKATVPVFQRSPDERRSVPIQIFVLRVAAGGAGVVPTAAGSQMWSRDLRIIRETYARIGLTASTVVAPGTAAANIVKDGSDSAVLIDAPAGVNPAAVDTAAENALSTSFPALADTVRLFYVARLTTGNRGEAWPDVDAPGLARRGSAYINASSTASGPYSPAHEIVHLLTNKSVTVNGGHYLAPTAPAGNRLRNNQNLMRNGTSSSEGVSESKRLWDAPDGNGLNQFTAIRGSHYTRA